MKLQLDMESPQVLVHKNKKVSEQELVEPMAFEDIPKHLEEFLTKALGRKVTIEGDNRIEKSNKISFSFLL